MSIMWCADGEKYMNKFKVILTAEEINLIINLTYELEGNCDSHYPDQSLKDLRNKFNDLERVNE